MRKALQLCGVLLLLGFSVAFIWLVTRQQYDYFTLEGRITAVKGRERITVTWDDDDGSHGLTFVATSLPLPIGENVKITYYYIGPHSNYPIIENVEVIKND